MIVLPYPVSANAYWRTVTSQKRDAQAGVRVVAHTIVSEEGREYRKRCAWIVAQVIRSPIVGPVLLYGNLYGQRPADWSKRARKNPNWFDEARIIDTGNADKVLQDALNGIAYADDKQVRFLLMQRREPDDAGARLEVFIEPYGPAALERVQRELAKQIEALQREPEQRAFEATRSPAIVSRPKLAHRRALASAPF